MKTLSHAWLTAVAVMIAIMAMTSCSSGAEPTPGSTRTTRAGADTTVQPNPTGADTAVQPNPTGEAALPQEERPDTTTASSQGTAPPAPASATRPPPPTRASFSLVQPTSTPNPDRKIVDIRFKYGGTEAYTFCMIFDDRSAQCDIKPNDNERQEGEPEFSTFQFDPPVTNVLLLAQQPYVYAVRPGGGASSKGYNAQKGQYVDTKDNEMEFIAHKKEVDLRPAYLDDNWSRALVGT